MENIEASAEVIEQLKKRLSEKSAPKKVFFNIYEDCLDVEE